VATRVTVNPVPVPGPGGRRQPIRPQRGLQPQADRCPRSLERP